MGEPWFAYALIFGAVFLAALLVQGAVRGMVHRDRRAAGRFAALDPGDKIAREIDVLRRKDFSSGLSLLSRLRLMIAQSGTSLTFERACVVATAIWLPLALVAPLPWPWPYRLAATGFAAAALVYAYLARQRSRRIAAFAEQLPDIIDVIVRSLRAGHPLPISLSLVARELPEPAGPQFAAVVDEISYGRDISGALEQLEKRIGYRELRFMVASIAIAQQTGGNLAEILSRLSRMLRERLRMKRKVLALSAEGRFSGYALTSLPLVLFGVIHLVSSDYYTEFWESAHRSSLLAIGCALLLIGNYVIYKMVHFKV